MHINEFRHYGTSYFKTNKNLENFRRDLDFAFMDNPDYKFSTDNHDKLIFFEIEKIKFLKKRIEGTYSQRDDYAILAIVYYSSTLIKWFTSLFIFGLLILNLLRFILDDSVYKMSVSAGALIYLAYLAYLILFFREEKKIFKNLINTGKGSYKRISKQKYLKKL